MRRFLAPALALFPAVPLVAQVEDAAVSKPSKAAAIYDALIADQTVATREYNLARRALEMTEPYREAIEKRDRAALTKLSQSIKPVDTKPLVERAFKAAQAFAGTDDAVPFLTFVIKNGRSDREAAKAAAAALIEDHLKSPKILPLAEDLIYAAGSLGQDGAKELAEAITLESEDDLVQAWTLYWSAYAVQRNRNATDEEKETAKKDLEMARNLAAGTPLAERIDAPEFQKERLQVGMVAPDIEGIDLDDVPFKLSDYRGKVVVIDFWGDW